MDRKSSLKWYQKPIWIIVLVFLFFPLGLFLVWIKKDWSKRTKWIITCVFIFLLIFAGISNNSNPNKDNSTSSGSTPTTTTSTPLATPKPPQTLKEKIKAQLGDGESFVIENAVNIDTNEPLVGKKQITITRNLGDNLFSIDLAKTGAQLRTTQLSQNIFPLDDSIATLQVTTNIPVTDVYGKNKTDELELAIITRDTYNKIQWNNFDYHNIPTIADSYFENKNIK